MKNSMYITIKSVIERGNFKISDIIPKIRQECFAGLITDEERDELIELVHEKVNPQNEAPDVMDIIAKVLDRMDSFEAILKEHIKAEQPEEPADPETPVDPEEPAEPEYPEWKPWDGISKDHQKDAIVSHNGKLWQSTFDGQNVWEPGTPGIDERYHGGYLLFGAPRRSWC